MRVGDQFNKEALMPQIKIANAFDKIMTSLKRTKDEAIKEIQMIRNKENSLSSLLKSHNLIEEALRTYKSHLIEVAKGLIVDFLQEEAKKYD